MGDEEEYYNEFDDDDEYYRKDSERLDWWNSRRAQPRGTIKPYGKDQLRVFGRIVKLNKRIGRLHAIKQRLMWEEIHWGKVYTPSQIERIRKWCRVPIVDPREPQFPED